jgi:hypothetical protein
VKGRKIRYRILAGEPEGKNPLVWNDNISMNLRVVDYEDVDWV